MACYRMKGENFVQRPKQPIKRTAPLKKIIAAALFALILFSLVGCSFFGPKEDRTEWIVDGEYSYLGEEETVEKLLEYIQAGDADSIYQVFSQTAKDTSGKLRDKIEELIEFVNGEMISWEYYKGGPFQRTYLENGMMRNRVIEFFIQTEQARYYCILKDIMDDDFDPDNKGFSSITIAPEEAFSLCNYGSFDGDGLGIFLSYQVKTYEEGSLESLIELAGSRDSGGIYDLFSDYAKESVSELPAQIDNLVDFLGKPIRSWEVDNCATEWVQLPGIDGKLLRRMTVFSLHTDEETYTLQIRDLLDSSEEGENLGLYSVAVHTEQYTGMIKDLGWLTPGIFIYQLTIEPRAVRLEGGGTVRFTTSIEATITCDSNGIVLRQIDALIWEATIPPDRPGLYKFTATAGEEYVICAVSNRTP